MRARRRLGTPLKRDTVALLVRERIANGTLKPGGTAPSGMALARETGYSVVTCRAALRALVKNGMLTPGVTPAARLRVPRPDGSTYDADTLRATLSKTLRTRRHAEGLTQPQLAAKLGVSVTTIGHAETGRTWQSRPFWFRADQFLGNTGGLLRMYDRFAAAEFAPEKDDDARPQEPTPASPPPAVSVTITASGVAIVWADGTETLASPPAAS